MSGDDAAKGKRRWFARKGEKEHGPFTSDQLKKLIATKRLEAGDEI